MHKCKCDIRANRSCQLIISTQRRSSCCTMLMEWILHSKNPRLQQVGSLNRGFSINLWANCNLKGTWRSCQLKSSGILKLTREGSGAQKMRRWTGTQTCMAISNCHFWRRARNKRVQLGIWQACFRQIDWEQRQEPVLRMRGMRLSSVRRINK